MGHGRCVALSLTTSAVSGPSAGPEGLAGDRLYLPHPPDGAAGPSSYTELSCSKNEKELEELLLEASQESGQETL